MTQSNSPKITVVIKTVAIYYLERGGTDTETLCFTSFAAEYNDSATRQKNLNQHVSRLKEVAKLETSTIAPNTDSTKFSRQEDRDRAIFGDDCQKVYKAKAIKATKMTAKEKRDRAIFGDDRQKAYEQFLIIKEELTAIGVKFGKLECNQSTIKCWRLDWGGDKAGLYWTPNEWTVEPLKCGQELQGNWEDFDLEAQLGCNDVSFTDYEE